MTNYADKREEYAQQIRTYMEERDKVRADRQYAETLKTEYEKVGFDTLNDDISSRGANIQDVINNKAYTDPTTISKYVSDANNIIGRLNSAVTVLSYDEEKNKEQITALNDAIESWKASVEALNSINETFSRYKNNTEDYEILKPYLFLDREEAIKAMAAEYGPIREAWKKERQTTVSDNLVDYLPSEYVIEVEQPDGTIEKIAKTDIPREVNQKAYNDRKAAKKAHEDRLAELNKKVNSQEFNVIQDYLTQLTAIKKIEELENASFLENVGYAFTGGVDNFFKNTVFRDRHKGKSKGYDPTIYDMSVYDYAIGQVRENAVGDNFLAGLAFDIAANYGQNFVPSLLSRVPKVGKILSAGAMYENVFNSTYKQAVRFQGMTQKQAKEYAFKTAISEVGLNLALGGIGKTGGFALNKLAPSLSKGFEKAAGKFLVKFGLKLGGEYIEGLSQSILETVYEKQATGEDIKWEDIDWEQAAYEGLVEAASAGISSVGYARYTAKAEATKQYFTQVGEQVINDGALQTSIDSSLDNLQNDKNFTNEVTDIKIAINKKDSTAVGESINKFNKAVGTYAETELSKALINNGFSKKQAQAVAGQMISVLSKTTNPTALNTIDNLEISLLSSNPQTAQIFNDLRNGKYGGNAVKMVVQIAQNLSKAQAQANTQATQENANLGENKGSAVSQGQSAFESDNKGTISPEADKGFSIFKPTQALKSKLEKVASKFGLTIEYFNGDPDTVGNGNYIKGTKVIRLNESSKKPTAIIFAHELVHYLAQDGVYNKLRNMLFKVDKNGKYTVKSAALKNWIKKSPYADLTEAMQAYKETYKGQYANDENFNAKVEEELIADFLADTLFGQNVIVEGNDITEQFATEIQQQDQTLWEKIKQAIKHFIDLFKDTDDIQRDLNKIAKKLSQMESNLAKQKTSTKNGEVMKSIIIDNRGRSVVLLDRNIFNGITNFKKRAEALQDWLLNNFGGTKHNTSDYFFVVMNERTAGKMPFWNKNLSEFLYDKKLSAAEHIDELIKIAKFKRHSNNFKDKHKEFASKGWNYFKSYFTDGVRTYEVDISVALSNDNSVVYNIGKINDIGNFNKKENSYSLNGSPNKSATILTKEATNRSSTNKIPQTEQNVNPKIDERKSLTVDSEGNTLTEAQQEYFKDSKVRDDNGNLMVVYHGTDAEFNVFDNEKIGSNTKNFGFYGTGFYFTNDLNQAKDYAQFKKSNNQNIVTVYLKISNPFVWNNVKTKEQLQKLETELGLEKGILKWTEGYAPYAISEFKDKNKVQKFTEALKNNNYDGVIFETDNINQYVIFDSNQAKLTTNENPTESEDIRYSKSVDSEYLELAKDPQKNEAKLREMVDDAAKDSGYNSPLLYHGTSAFGFTEFDLEKMDDKRSIFLTNNPNIASTYSGITGERKISEAYRKDINELSMPDLTKELNNYANNIKGKTQEEFDYEFYNFDKFNNLLSEVNSGIDKLAKTVENNIKIYADKLATDFDEKDYKIHSQLVKLLESLKKYDYNNLSTPIYLLLHNTNVFEGSQDIAILEKNIRLMNQLRTKDLSEGVIAAESLGGYWIEILNKEEAQSELENLTQQGNYSLFAKLEKSLVIDGKGQLWNDIRGWQQSAYYKRDNVEIKKVGDEYRLYDKATNTEIHNGTMAVNSFTEGLEKSQLLTMMLDNANYSMRISTENYLKTRDISGWAKSAGYDSVVFKNIRDNGGRNSNIGASETADIYVIFDNKNIKSADLVTYDDNGDIIPLSERFKEDNTDIRYSKNIDLTTLPDSELSDAVENETITKEQAEQELMRRYGKIPNSFKPKQNIVLTREETEKEGFATSAFVDNVIRNGKFDANMTDEQKAEILKAAKTHKIITDKAAIQKVKTALNDNYEKAVAEWQAYINVNNKGIKQIGKNEIALGQQLMQHAAENGNVADTVKYLAELTEAATRAGQVVQAFSMLKKMGGIGRLYYINRTLAAINADIEKRFGNKGKKIELDSDLALKLANDKTQAQIDALLPQIYEDIADQMPVSWLDRWNTWRYLSMLGNLKTHVRNFAGNVFFAGTRFLRDFSSALMQLPMKAENKTRVLWTDPQYRKFARQYFFKHKNDILDGGRKNDLGYYLQHSRKPFGKKGIARPFNWLANKNFDALEFEDNLFKQLNFVHTFAQYLQAKNINLDTVSEEQLLEAEKYATDEAREATFQEDNAIANAITKFSRQTKGIGSFLVEGILPFKRTPINILKQSINYSPIGLMKTLSKGAYDLKTGKITAAEFLDGLSEGLTGTGIFALGMLLGSLGVAIGGLDPDDEEDKMYKLNGGQEYSIIFGDTSYTFDWAVPASLPFFMGVEFQKNLTEDEGKGFINALLTSGQGLIEPITNLSMLAGINDMLTAIKWAEGNEISNALTEALSSFALQNIPTVLGQTARTIDDVRRTNYIDKGSDTPAFIQKFLQKVQSKIPLWESEKNAYINAWGEEQSNGGVVGRILQNFVSPGYVSKYTDDSVNEKLVEIYLENDNDGGVLPSAPSKSFTVDGETKYLTPSEYEEFARECGQTKREYIEEALDNKTFDDLSSSQQAKVIKNLYSYATAKAKTTVSDYELSNAYKKVANLESIGISPVTFYIASALTSIENADEDDSGTITKKEKQKALKEAGIDRKTINEIVNYDKDDFE